MGPRRDRDVIIGILISGARSSTQSPVYSERERDPSLSVCATEPSKGALSQSGLCQKGPIYIQVPREPLWKMMGFGDVPDSPRAQCSVDAVPSLWSSGKGGL